MSTDLQLIHEKERIEVLRELKRVLTNVLELQHADSGELTEDDPSVNELIIWVERCLWHGLRKSLVKGEKFEKESRVTLWSVLSSSKLSIPKGSTEEDIHDFSILEQTIREVSDMLDIKTETGKSRVWVRLAINKGVLGAIGWLREQDTQVFYEVLSIWRSPEQRSIAVSLLGSLRGLKFALKLNNGKFDTDPEPSRRPHFLGISSMKVSPRKSPVSPKGEVATPVAISQSVESKARKERTENDREAIEALKEKTTPKGHQQASETNSFSSWLKGAIGWAATPPTPPNSVEKPKQHLTPKFKPPPAFLGSTLAELVFDPRTCENALLDWRIGIPKSISSLLAIIDLEESDDPFDPRHVSEEDDPYFVQEVASLIRRLSDRETSSSSAGPSKNAWDGGSPSLIAIAALKLFFRQLPEPIIPYDQYEALVACQKIGDSAARTRNIKFLVDSIPDAHKPTLHSLIDMVGRKIDANVTDFISASNSLAPALLRPRPGPEGGLGKTSEAAELVSLLIENREEIFKDIENDINERSIKLKAKLGRIEKLYLHSKRGVEWPGTDDEAYMKRLWEALDDGTNTDPKNSMFSPTSDGWITRGFRTNYMTHDFRGCGFSALEHLVYFAETYPSFALQLLAKHRITPNTGINGLKDEELSFAEKVSMEEMRKKFPFALGAAQLSRAIVEMLGVDPKLPNFEAKSIAELSTWPLFDDENCSGHVFSLAMRLLDYEWTKENAKAMDYNRIKREVVVRLADLIDFNRPRSVNELTNILIKETPVMNDLKPESPTKKRVYEQGEEEKSFEVSPSAPKSSEVYEEEETKNSINEPKIVPGNEFLPQLLYPSVTDTALNSNHVAALESALPSEYRGYDWELVFSSNLHGFNIDSFFEKASGHIVSILVISELETNGIFGGFCTETWKNRGEDYYGTGQSFLFSFTDEGSFHVHQWTRLNNFFMFANEDCLAMGQGNGGFGLYIDSDLKQGTSSACETYGNLSPLCGNNKIGKGSVDGTNQEFTCRSVELWSFVPKSVRHSGH